MTSFISSGMWDRCFCPAPLVDLLIAIPSGAAELAESMLLWFMLVDVYIGV